jgi:catechol 2,3-dioxygenase-like lactoylglutathione lyase family enzyme
LGDEKDKAVGEGAEMKYISNLIVVKDLERSKAFYKQYLAQEVIIDYGANVTLAGGFSLQTLESWQGFIGGLDVSFKGNNAELYFEAEDFDAFIKNLDGMEFVNPPYEQPWGQRCTRFYDPDGHMIEVGENIEPVVRRFYAAGMTIPEIAVRMDVKEEYVREWLEENVKL